MSALDHGHGCECRACRLGNHGSTVAYRFGCRCSDCCEARRAYDRSRRGRGTRPGVPDDGIIDEIAVERLIAGTLEWTGATISEREEAARRTRGREGWNAWCETALNLRDDRIRRVRLEGCEVAS